MSTKEVRKRLWLQKGQAGWSAEADSYRPVRRHGTQKRTRL